MEQLSLDFQLTDATALGVRAFGFCSGDIELTEQLLAGARRDELPHLLTQPAFLVRVLDALIANETTLAWFAGTVGVPVTFPYEARRLLHAAATQPDRTSSVRR